MTRITHKTAVLAKEKGYNEPNRYYSDSEDPTGEVKISLFGLTYSSSESKTLVTRPTQSELQKWLRDEHRIHMYVEPYWNTREDAMNNVKPSYVWWNIYGYLEDSEEIDGYFDTYEEALEVALFESLKVIAPKLNNL